MTTVVLMNLSFCTVIVAVYQIIQIKNVFKDHFSTYLIFNLSCRFRFSSVMSWPNIAHSRPLINVRPRHYRAMLDDPKPSDSCQIMLKIVMQMQQ